MRHTSEQDWYDRARNRPYRRLQWLGALWPALVAAGLIAAILLRVFGGHD
jgi:hypothetical protein